MDWEGMQLDDSFRDSDNISRRPAPSDGHLSKEEEKGKPGVYFNEIPGNSMDWEEEEGELSDTEKAAIMLADIIAGSWRGCSSLSHEIHLQAHMQEEENNHNRLSATYKSFDKTGKRPQNAGLGLSSLGFPAASGMPRKVYADSRMLLESFHRMVEDGGKLNICLHEEQVAETQSFKVFDLNSLIIVLQTLVAIMTTLRWTPTRHVAPNIQSDLHMEIEVNIIGADGKLKRRKLQPRAIPYLFLGTIDSLAFSNLYIFCLRLYKEGRPTNFLTADQVKRFTDFAMIPACEEYLKVDRIQHLPLSQKVSEQNSRARGAEQRTGRSGESA